MMDEWNRFWPNMYNLKKTFLLRKGMEDLLEEAAQLIVDHSIIHCS